MISIKSRKHQGFSLVEVAASLVVVSLSMVTLFRMQNDASDTVRAQGAAGRLQEISVAARSYMTANSTALLASTAGSATVSIPVAGAPSSTSLQGQGLLASSFVDMNAYGQHHVLLVRQPNVGNLEAIVVQVGGRQINDTNLGRIITKVGASGGSVMANITPTTLQGTAGGWSTPISSWGNIPQVGHAAASINLSTAALAEYLYRDNIGIPAANQMSTAIDMGGGLGKNDINHAGTVNAQQAILQEGGFACKNYTLGCTFWISKEGGFRDDNDGWIRFMGQSTNGAGLTVESAAPGNGNLYVQDNATISGVVGTNGLQAASNMPPTRGGYVTNGSGIPIWTAWAGAAFQGGVHTQDTYAEGTLSTGTNGTIAAQLNSNGSGFTTSTFQVGTNLTVGNVQKLPNMGAGQNGDIIAQDGFVYSPELIDIVQAPSNYNNYSYYVAPAYQINARSIYGEQIFAYQDVTACAGAAIAGGVSPNCGFRLGDSRPASGGQSNIGYQTSTSAVATLADPQDNYHHPEFPGSPDNGFVSLGVSNRQGLNITSLDGNYRTANLKVDGNAYGWAGLTTGLTGYMGYGCDYNAAGMSGVLDGTTALNSTDNSQLWCQHGTWVSSSAGGFKNVVASAYNVDGTQQFGNGSFTNSSGAPQFVSITANGSPIYYGGDPANGSYNPTLSVALYMSSGGYAVCNDTIAPNITCSFMAPAGSTYTISGEQMHYNVIAWQ